MMRVLVWSFWRLQPCKVRMKACRRWDAWPFSQVEVGISKSHSPSCSLLWLGCCLAPAGIPWDHTQSQQILGSLQLCTAGAFWSWKQESAWKSSSREFICSDNWYGQQRELSAVQKRFFQDRSFQNSSGQKYHVMAGFENTSYPQIFPQLSEN